MSVPSIAIFVSHPSLKTEGLTLAKRLNLPYIENQTQDYDFFLVLTPNYLGLQKAHSKPLFIDFSAKKIEYRRKQATFRSELLARALGLKKISSKKIVDATAGLVRDSFILASLGCEVIVLERSPIIFVLIEDAIKRAKQTPLKEIMNRLHLIQTDAISWLRNASDIERIYLDPMFPQTKKSALSKQDMRIFHEIVGEDLDANQLLRESLSCATERVVVKRPRLAEPLAGIRPTLSMKGSSNRFDIYLC